VERAAFLDALVVVVWVGSVFMESVIPGQRRM
jgi:hypothetical protein